MGAYGPRGDANYALRQHEKAMRNYNRVVVLKPDWDLSVHAGLWRACQQYAKENKAGTLKLLGKLLNELEKQLQRVMRSSRAFCWRAISWREIMPMIRWG